MRHALLLLFLAPLLASSQEGEEHLVTPNPPAQPAQPAQQAPPSGFPGRPHFRANDSRPVLPTAQPTGQAAPVPQPPSSPGRPTTPGRPTSAGARTASQAPVVTADGAKCTPLTGKVMLNFNKTDIVDVLEQASRWTCRNFIYTDEIAKGKISLLSTTAVTADEAYAAFLAALTSNNIAIYPTGKYFKLVRSADAKKAPLPVLNSEDGTPATEQPVTKIFRLFYTDADQLRGILGNFISPQGADVQSIPPDILVITDIGLNLRRIEKLIETVDRAGAGDLLRVVQIRFAPAKDIAEKVNQVFQAQAGAAGRPGTRRPIIAGARPSPSAIPGVPGAPVANGPTEVSIAKVIADDRTNKLIIVADEKSFLRIQELIDQIDVPATGTGGIHVVFLKHANAEELSQTLSNLAQGAAAARKAAGGAAAGSNLPGQAAAANIARSPPTGDVTAELFSGEVKVTADKTQNALLIQASGSDFVAISRLIDTLDRARRQIFVEAVIMEVDLTNENQFGVAMHGLIPYNTPAGTALIPVGSEPSSSFNSFNASSIIGLGGFLTGFAGPVSAEVKALGLNLPSLGVLVNALQTSSDVNVISTPHIVATDNEESEIHVGENVPFQAGIVSNALSSLLTGASSSTSTTTSSLLGTAGVGLLSAPIQRQNVELVLKIKPQITEGGGVRMNVDEQLEEIASTDPVLGPTTSKRSVKTQIVANDQSTIVIGGLIQNRVTRSVHKTPLLGDIPILGWLFRSTDTTTTKSNLLLFLTPYIIRDENDYRRIYEMKRKEQQDFVEQFYGRQPHYEVAVDWSRKPGPFAKIRAGVSEEKAKIENGGPGRPGEGVTRPPGQNEPAPAPGTIPTPTPDRAVVPESLQVPNAPQESPTPEGSTPAPGAPAPGAPGAPGATPPSAPQVPGGNPPQAPPDGGAQQLQ